MQTVPVFTPLTGGFITAQPLPDGKFVVESWWLNPSPSDSDKPYSEAVCHWVADDEDDARKLIAEFADNFARQTR